ncbi:helix-turn-helix domain-containing protein, partial [Streptomyces sp. SID5926]|nr:helix-turn-helix domain-containing protein [Streptomyces sp. SID5926]
MNSTTDRDGVRSAASAGRRIGPALRAAREARGMSLRALARQIGVSPSFLSQLERNKTNASVGTLYTLVEALDLSLDQLVSTDPGSPGAARPAPPAAEPDSPVPGVPSAEVSRFGAV